MRIIINPGIVLMLITATYQSVISVLVKSVASEITTEVQVLAYYIIPLSFFVPMIFKSGIAHYQTNRFLLHFSRSLFSASSVFCFFYTSQHLQLGIAAVLFNSAPVFVPLLARIFLKEPTSLIIYIGILVALTGIIIVINPGVYDFLSPLALIGLASGFLMAVATVFLRYMVKIGESLNNIVFYLYLNCTLVTVVVIAIKCANNFNTLQMHSSHKVFVTAMLCLLGIISLIAQKTLTKAFQHMPVGKLMPFLYMSVPISSLLGWVIWNQQFTFSIAIGTLFVITGVVIIMFEKNIKLLCSHKTENQSIHLNKIVGIQNEN